MKLTFEWESDEVCHIKVDDTKVFTMDHDAYGWDGMAGIRDALTAVVEADDGVIEIVGDEGV